MDQAEIRASVADVFGVSPDELAPDTELESLPTFDSLVRLSLMVCLSDLTGRPIELAALRRLRTYGDIEALVKAQAAE